MSDVEAAPDKRIEEIRERLAKAVRIRNVMGLHESDAHAETTFLLDQISRLSQECADKTAAFDVVNAAWKARVDDMLDERKALMAERDALTAEVAEVLHNCDDTFWRKEVKRVEAKAEIYGFVIDELEKGLTAFLKKIGKETMLPGWARKTIDSHLAAIPEPQAQEPNYNLPPAKIGPELEAAIKGPLAQKPCPEMPDWKCEKHGARLCDAAECKTPTAPSLGAGPEARR